MKIYICMQLLSDAIFGNGMSMPGGEDICILTDEHGFPYMKGSTLKGIFREELINYLSWGGAGEADTARTVKRLMGESGEDRIDEEGKVVFSDVTLHGDVIRAVLSEHPSKQEVLDMFSYLREFTELKDGLAKDGSLRSARCIQKGLHFYTVCSCSKEDEELVKSVIVLVKWIGTMRNRGFGKVSVEVEGTDE